MGMDEVRQWEQADECWRAFLGEWFKTHERERPRKPTADEFIDALSHLRKIRLAFWISHPDGPEAKCQSFNYIFLKDVLGADEFIFGMRDDSGGSDEQRLDECLTVGADPAGN